MMKNSENVPLESVLFCIQFPYNLGGGYGFIVDTRFDEGVTDCGKVDVAHICSHYLI